MVVISHRSTSWGESVVESDDLTIDAGEIRIPGFGKSVDLNLANPYEDMTGKK